MIGAFSGETRSSNSRVSCESPSNPLWLWSNSSRIAVTRKRKERSESGTAVRTNDSRIRDARPAFTSKPAEQVSGNLGCTTLSGRAGTHRIIVSNSLSSLRQRSFVTRDPETKFNDPKRFIRLSYMTLETRGLGVLRFLLNPRGGLLGTRHPLSMGADS